MKRICSLILVLCMCLATLPALAVKGDLDSAVFEVTSLGIFEGDENGDLKLDNTMTRAEFAKVVVVLIGMKDAVDSGKSIMKDVPADHWANGYISYLVETGLMSGYPDGTFRPDATITLDECLKTLLVVMGYEIVATRLGGYPDGYYSVAVEKEIVKGVKGGRKNAALRKDIILAIGNALDVPNVVNTVGNSISYYEDPSITLRNSIRMLDDLDYTTGVVTATADMWLNAPNTSMRSGQIEINGFLYDVNPKILDAANKYIGQEVVAYYKYDDSMAFPMIHNIQSTARNTVTVIKREDMRAFTADVIKYETGSNKKYEIGLTGETRYIYNGRPVSSPDDSFRNIGLGSYTVINNDYDNSPEFVIANEYTNYVVENAHSNGNLRLKFLGLVGGDTKVDSKSILLDLEKNNSFTIKDAYGRTISYNTLSEGMVVSVYANKLDNFKKIVVSNKETFAGKLTGKESEYNQVYIDDKIYTLDSYVMHDFVRLGEYYDFYPDAEGRIAFVEVSTENSSWKYGYIYDVAEINRTKELILIDAGKITNSSEQNYADATATTTKTTSFQNNAVIYLTMADRVKVDGQNYSSSEVNNLKEKVVKYSLNEEGELKYIETLTPYSGAAEMTYVTDESIFVDTTGANSNSNMDFIIDNDTQVICIPENLNPEEDDFLVKLTPDKVSGHPSYSYDQNTENNAAKLIKINVEMNANATAADYTPDKYSKVGIVGDVKHLFDENYDEFLKVTVATNGGVKTLDSLPLYNRVALKNLQKGDIIFYKEDVDGKLDKVSVAGNADSLIAMAISEKLPGAGCSIDVGFATAIEMNVVQHIQEGKDVSKSKRVHKITFARTDYVVNDEDKYIHIRNMPPIFIYDREEGSVSMGTFDDIVFYPTRVANMEKLIILDNGAEIPTERAIIIVR